MNREKIGAIILWILSLFFALCAIIVNDQPLSLTYLSFSVSFISILLSLKACPNYSKDFTEIKEVLKSLQNQSNHRNKKRKERQSNRKSKFFSRKEKKTTNVQKSPQK